MSKEPFNFEAFIKSGKKNAWIQEPGISIYVRISLKQRGTDYDLATMTAFRPGKKALTKFLNKYEPRYRFFIENVFEPSRLGKFFLKRGYEEVKGHSSTEDQGPKCYARKVLKDVK